MMIAALFTHGAELAPGQARVQVVAIEEQATTTWVHWKLLEIQPGPTTPRSLEAGATYQVRTDQPCAFCLGQTLVATPTHGLAMGPEGDISYLQWADLRHADGQPVKRTHGEGHILSLQGPTEPIERSCRPPGAGYIKAD